MTPTITTFRWVPPMARGFVRDLRPRWACEEEGLSYDVHLVDFEEAKSADYRRNLQPFGQVPVYRDDEITVFESGAMSLRIAEQGTKLLPIEPGARWRAIEWTFAALNSVEQYVMQLAVCDAFEADKPWSPMRRPTVVADLEKRLGDLETAIGDKTWLDGDVFTVGDLTMISVLGGLRNNPELLTGFPKLAAYIVRGEDRPAHRRAMAAQLELYDHAKEPA
jgi:glutathione S-transferase